MISSEAFIEKYKKPIMYTFLVIVVLVAGYFLYRSFVLTPREEKANEMIFKGQQYFATDSYEKALNGDGQGFPGFLSIANEYGSTKAGNLAQLYAGLSYAKMGKFQEAVNYLKNFKDCSRQSAETETSHRVRNTTLPLHRWRRGSSQVCRRGSPCRPCMR